MTKMRVAVTGGSGRIGQAVCRNLEARGHSVVNLDKRQPPPDQPGKFVFCDVRNREVVQPVLAECDAVCHLGEIPNNGSHPGDYLFAFNTAACSTVIQTAADLKMPRAIYTSTCQTYGCWGDVVVPPVSLPLTETHPLQPQQPYAVSKVANELFVEMIAKRTGLSLAIFRFPGTFAWREVDGEPWRTLEHSGKKPADGAGTYCHVEDAAEAYALALENPRPGCEAYHFAAADVFSLVPVRELLKLNYPTAPELPASHGRYASWMSMEKAREHFGWTPKYSILDEYRKRFGKEPGT